MSVVVRVRAVLRVMVIECGGYGDCGPERASEVSAVLVVVSAVVRCGPEGECGGVGGGGECGLEGTSEVSTVVVAVVRVSAGRRGRAR